MTHKNEYLQAASTAYYTTTLPEQVFVSGANDLAVYKGLLEMLAAAGYKGRAKQDYPRVGTYAVYSRKPRGQRRQWVVAIAL